MKNKFILYTAIVFSIGFASCKKTGFLDQTATESLTTQKVFSDSTYTFNFLNNIYSFVGQDVVYMRYHYVTSGTGNDYACLEDLTNQSVSYYSDPQASWIGGKSTSTNDPFNKYYAKYYTEIRACNQFMQNVKNAPLSTPIKIRTTAEARFLRAWYYAELVRVYGGVMLVGDEPLDITAVVNYTRNTYKQCIDYIAGQCDTAALDLPSALTQQPSDYGRITSGICMALKARTLLTAASPLFNGSQITSDATMGLLLCYSATYDATLWQKAADAFKAVINTGVYNLYTDGTHTGNAFRNLFLQRQNVEYIFPYMNINEQPETIHYPLSRSASGGYSTPSQNLVDHFYMKNGLAISDPASGYDANAPYANLDPRFYHTIIVNQYPLYLSASQKMVPVNIYSTVASNGTATPTQDGLQTYHTKTGYYCNKFTNDSVPITTKTTVLPIIRYAEILLGYAEAINEAQGPTSEVYSVIYKIRDRAGITPGASNNYGLSAGLSKADMRAIIQNEYRVELAYEGHWFYDSRRWRLLETDGAAAVQAMNCVMNSNGTYTYTRLPSILATAFTPKQYFFPFPAAEPLKSATFLQNPGW